METITTKSNDTKIGQVLWFFAGVVINLHVGRLKGSSAWRAEDERELCRLALIGQHVCDAVRPVWGEEKAITWALYVMIGEYNHKDMQPADWLARRENENS